jgi:WD40 repeat protein
MLIAIGLVVHPSSAGEAAPGDTLWVATYDGPGNAIDEALDTVTNPDGSRVYVTGASDGDAGLSDYATVAYDATTGAAVWGRRYNGPGDSTDEAHSIAVSPDGTRVFVTGYSFGGASSYDYATVAYDAATGAREWVRRYLGPSGSLDSGTSVAVSPDGTKVYVTGYSFGGFRVDYDYATIAYDTATGAQLWVRGYNGPGSYTDVALALAASPDGTGVFVTGYSHGRTSGPDYATIAYDATTGAKEWVRRYNGPANFSDSAFSLAVSPDGAGVFVTGESDGRSGPYIFSHYATIAYDAATGSGQWVQRSNDGGSAYAVVVSPDGMRVFVTGGIGDDDESDYATFEYDAATGLQGWAQVYDGPGNAEDVARAVMVSPDGTEIYVTGYSDTGVSGLDYATLAYDATAGTVLWTSLLNGAGNADDSAFELAVSPDGAAVFATGSGVGLGSDEDYMTVAYTTS